MQRRCRDEASRLEQKPSVLTLLPGNNQTLSHTIRLNHFFLKTASMILAPYTSPCKKRLILSGSALAEFLQSAPADIRGKGKMQRRCRDEAARPEQKLRSETCSWINNQIITGQT